ncbi:MAG TPA: hypothetical protein DEQ68_04985 [Ruminococcaceae bacterium]|nr:hypothetical protein [Oscillospiraceae bacterium]
MNKAGFPPDKAEPLSEKPCGMPEHKFIITSFLALVKNFLQEFQKKLSFLRCCNIVLILRAIH